MNGAPVFVAILLVAAAGTFLATRRPRGPRPADRLVSAVVDVLPGGNCGACGNDSCFDAALRIANGRLPASACVTGGEDTAEAVSAALRAGPVR